jgi:hypothetical protein
LDPNLKETAISRRFPKRQQTDVTAEIGVNAVSSVVNDQMGWIFRRTHQEHDFGVDGYIDFVSCNGDVTGRFIAVQIKCGFSYLTEKRGAYWYQDSIEHLNFLLNQPVAVLLVLCNPSTRVCFFSELNRELVVLAKTRWSHPIPKNQTMSIEFKANIAQLFGGAVDHLPSLQEDRELRDFIESASVIQYSVPLERILRRDVSPLKEFFHRLTQSEAVARSVQGKLLVTVAGYEDDGRELYQIRDVRKWAKKARRKISDWYLCATDSSKHRTLTWFAASTCQIQTSVEERENAPNKVEIEFNSYELSGFVSELFEGLNEAASRWHWSDAYNRHISDMIALELVPDAIEHVLESEREQKHV